MTTRVFGSADLCEAMHTNILPFTLSVGCPHVVVTSTPASTRPIAATLSNPITVRGDRLSDTFLIGAAGVAAVLFTESVIRSTTRCRYRPQHRPCDVRTACPPAPIARLLPPATHGRRSRRRQAPTSKGPQEEPSTRRRPGRA